MITRISNGIVATAVLLSIGCFTGANYSTPEAPYIMCGNTESDCYPDYRGNGKWVMVPGERP